MNNMLKKFKDWFQSRDLREKLLVTLLSWALIYASFSLILFRPLDNANNELTENIKKTNDEIGKWEAQLAFLKEIPKSAIYKEWVNSNQNYQTLQNKYKSMLGKPGSNTWDEIIKAVLTSYPNITIEKIENLPEAIYKASNKPADNKPADSAVIYQQIIKVHAFGTFSDVVGYLTTLETTLPNIHWDSMNYQVTDYPLARVELEFSVLYEKPKTA